MNFVLGEKIEALQRAGYEIKDETMMVLERRSGNMDSEISRVVQNVYFNGELMCAWGAAGTYRVDWVFNRELEKRLLKLF